MSQRISSSTNLAGQYSLAVNVTDWETQDAVEIDGILHVTPKETHGYEWRWRFEARDPAQGCAVSECFGRTLFRFIEAAATNDLVSVPREQIKHALLGISPLRDYVKKVLSGEELDGEQLEVELDKQSLRSEQQSREADLKQREQLQAQAEQQKTLLDEIKSAIANRDLAALLTVCRAIGVNTEFRKYSWHGVYTQETALSLAAQAGWREGARALVQEGALTDGVVAETDSRHRTRYHDLSAFTDSKTREKST